ncbi:MAG TPA: peptidoglycan DD-metalloendopeptidase family protein [Acidimicrobiales bacterium]|nr:peptidoglycan DD-metalloendopeptidase family protein [Acidimicrobiales bacterium]
MADPFRPPAGPYGAGNRGIEYRTEPGTPVRASAGGTVSFAGPVGGALHVTVAHADGVRTSYSFLATAEVVVGQRVAQGRTLGTSGARLHFGARIGGAYFDPAALFAATVTEVELLPLGSSPGGEAGDAGAEARALAEVAFAGGSSVSLPEVDAALGWLRERGDAVGDGLRTAADLADRLLFRGPCSSGTPPLRPVAGQRRVAVTVAGLGSSSASAAIDDLRVDDLGYDSGRVVRFSYAGGRTPSTGAAFAGIDASDYGSADTLGDVLVAARRLATLVRQVAEADPAATVDVYAHSLGGVVARLALGMLAEGGFDPGRLGLVATLGTPHGGADLATAVAAGRHRPAGRLALEVADAALGTGLDPDAVVVDQLAEGSPVVRRLAAEGAPGGVRLVSIAARGDLVVASPRSRIDGATNVTVPVAGLSAHGEVVGSDAATAEMARALAGRPPGCEPWGDRLADVLTGHAIAAVEDQIGAVAAAPAW